MIRLELKPQLSLRLKQEIRFYNANDRVVFASDIALCVLEQIPDFPELSVQERRRLYRDYIREAKKAVRTPKPFHGYDTACEYVRFWTARLPTFVEGTHRVIPINSVAFTGCPADMKGYRTVSQEPLEGERQYRFLTAFGIDDGAIPSKFLDHLVTLCLEKSASAKGIENVFGAPLKVPNEIPCEGVAICGYGTTQEDILFEDIRYQRNTA